MSDQIWNLVLRKHLAGNRKAEIDLADRYPKDDRGRPRRGEGAVPASAVRRAILREAKKPQVRRDFRIKNALIADTLHLEHLQFHGYLRFENCRFGGRIDLRHARLRRLKFENCLFEEIVEADVAEIAGDTEIRNCTFRKGVVFRAARVSGRFVVEASEIDKINASDRRVVTPEASLDAAMLQADHGLSFRGIGERKTTLNGMLDLTSARVGGHVEFIGTAVTPCVNQLAVDLTNATLNGFLFIRDNTSFAGQLNLFAASLQLFSISDRSSIRTCKPYAIDAEEVKVATSFTLGGGVQVDGINLNSAQIGGVFQFGGRADSSNESGPSGTADDDISVEGTLNLSHARIGRLCIDFGRWIERCHTKHMTPLLNGCIYDDIVNINGRDSVGKDTLCDWVQTIADEDGSDDKSPSKTDWRRLFRMDTDSIHHPQVFHQLISVLRNKGRMADARQVEELAAKRAVFSKYNRKLVIYIIPLLMSLMRRWLTGYGHSVYPLMKVSLAYVAVMSFVYLLAYRAGEFLPADPIIYSQHAQPAETVEPEPADGYWLWQPFVFQTYRLNYPRLEYTSFHPFLYSLDVFLPIVDLSQERAWSPVTRSGEVSWLWLLMVAQILLGWVFSGLLIAFFSGIIRKRP